jgi:GNAT superfamily N-acetyltransferase
MLYTIDNLTIIRFANENDIGIILGFIKELAEFEGMLDKVEATEELLLQTIFQDNKAEVLICEYDSKPVGFALFFHNFSTFLGKPGIYLEDLYVKPEMRNKGIGKKIISVLGKIALERNCGRLEWWCLDWNKKSIDFYLGLGAKAMEDWTVYRVAGNELVSIAEII